MEDMKKDIEVIKKVMEDMHNKLDRILDNLDID